MLGWIAAGQLRWREDVVAGPAPTRRSAFIGLLKGANFGKLVVEVD